MPQLETGRFTVGVFQDVAWAAKGLEALTRQNFPVESLTAMGKESPELAALIENTWGAPGTRIDVKNVGAVLAHGPLVEALDSETHDFARQGIAATMRRVGFQSHDGRIFETLMVRGGVLVAIKSDPRAADALAILHSYGGGNAAIGAWTGRV